jgi:DNA-binding CsgD family transcriptional regulator
MTQTEIDSAAEEPAATRGPGRPKIEFTEKERDQIIRMAEVGCTQQEIAHVMAVSIDVIQKHKDLIDAGKSHGKVKLRRVQMAKALEGNPTMLIWLGKQMLGQSENPVSDEDGIVLPFES